MISQVLQPADIAREFLDRVYPADLFGETFSREQVAWIMAVYEAGSLEGE